MVPGPIPVTNSAASPCRPSFVSLPYTDVVMVGTVRLIVRWALRGIVLWAVLVYGTPPLERGVRTGCVRWKIERGVCGTTVLAKLTAFRDWTQRVLRPLSRHEKVRWAVAQLRGPFARLETLARENVGDERIASALREAQAAVGKLEGIAGATGRDAREKVTAIPGNAQQLITDARVAVDRLGALLGATTKRAEDLAQAVSETRRALEVVSAVLPERKAE